MKLTKEDIITIAIAVEAFLLIKKFYKFFGGGTKDQTNPEDIPVDEAELTYPQQNYFLWFFTN